MALGCLLTVPLSLDYAIAQGTEKLNVVLVSIDTLRADYVGCYGAEKDYTPHLDALAGDGLRFETAVSEVPLTLPAHCSLMTGKYPPTHGVRDNLGYVLADPHVTLAEVLENEGYSTGAFVGAYVVHSKWGLNQGFQSYDDDLESAEPSVAAPLTNYTVERRAGDVAAAALSWLGRQQKEQPFFCWIHLFDPHDPYEPPEPFRSRFPGDPYGGEVAYSDHVLGQVITSLREKGLYERSLIVVVGDHGESLGEHGELTHGFFLYDPTLLVPMIMKPPGTPRYKAKTGVVKGIFQLVDVMPTILQVLGVNPPDGLQGQGLVALILGKRSSAGRAAYSETYYPNEFGWNELNAWRTSEHKYILAPRPELYDLLDDPAESRNLINRESALANQLETRLLDFKDRYSDQQSVQEAQKALSNEDLERFRSLGYIGGPRRGSAGADLSRPDPKDKIEEYAGISQAMTLIARRKCTQALPILKKLKQKDPSIVSVDSMIGQCYLQGGLYREAISALSGVVKADPQRVHPKVYLAQAHFHLKEYSEARRLLESVIQQDTSSFQAFNYLGLIYSDLGETSRALDAFNRAVSIQDDAEAYQMLGYLYTREGQPKNAAQALEQAIRLDPSHALAHLYLANAYMLMGKRDLGEREYRKALELDPSLREKLP